MNLFHVTTVFFCALMIYNDFPTASMNPSTMAITVVASIPVLLDTSFTISIFVMIVIYLYL